MIVDVFLIERIGQGVLRDNDQITPVEIRVATVLRINEALAQDHVGRHETPGIGAAENERVSRKILEHVVAVMPTEPVIALAAQRGIVDDGP